jgi:hypothetical protein
MLTFSVKSDIEAGVRNLNAKVLSQIPFATAKALTKTAQAVREAERREMASVFDRPTPWTLNSLFVKPANKVTLSAEVAFKGAAAKGTPYDRALAHHIRGGTREWKRMELALKRLGVLPSTWAAVPGEAAKLDGYGNMSRGQVVQILSYLQAFGEQGYKANMTAKGRARLARRGRTEGGFARIGGVEYFVSRGPGNWFGGRSWKNGRGQHLAPGVWQKSGIHGVKVRPVLMFVSTPSYRVRLAFYDVGSRVASTTFPIEFQKSIAEAMASAR